MATGYNRSIEDGHDVIYDYCCTTCEEENLNAEALYYCKDCSQLFCEPCKNAHDKYFKGHKVLGKKDVAKWGDVKPVTRSPMCDEHPEKELEMFCEDHDRLCCHTCISLKHRACKQVKTVSDVAKGIQNNSRFKSFLSDAPRAQSELKHFCDKQENNIELLQKARGKITSILQDMRKEFEQIEEKSTAEMDKLLTRLKEKITSDKNKCTDFHDKIQKFLADVQSPGKQCDELAFQGYKKCCEQVASAKELLSSMQDVDYKLEFTPDAKMKQCLSSLETLGTFHVSPLTSSDHVYSVVDKKRYGVTISRDTEKCNILGMCQLPDGQTAIVDKDNRKVKLLSTSTYSFLDTLKLPKYPWDICHTTGTELAVTVCDSKDRHEIQFINAENGKLSPTRTVQLDHGCYGIAYHNAQLYVGSYTALYVYNLSGVMIKKLYENTSGPTTVCRFSLSDDGSRIYVTNFSMGLLVTLDSSGNQLSTFSDPELQYPTGVCAADNGSVFVCGQDSHTVLQVDREGKKNMTTLATRDEVYSPESLCFDRKTHTLLVRQGNDILLALQLK